MIMMTKLKIGLIIVLIVSAENLGAQNKQEQVIPDTILFKPDFFDNEELFKLTLAFDINKYNREKEDEEYQPAVLTYQVSDSVKVVKNVRLKARGEYRQNHCDFSPYFINIKHAQATNDYIADKNKVKIVSHCKGSKGYTNYLLKEYMTYKMYNIITDYSFRVRLAEITYINTSGRLNKTDTYYAFFIEPEELMAERLNWYPLEMDKLNYSQIDSISTTRMSVFQYMIGNTDYSVAGRHNLKLLSSKDHNNPAVVPVAYDFDFAGIVNAFYALPSKKLDIIDVKDRYYYGMCRGNDLYDEVLNHFDDKRNEIFEFIETFEYVDKRTRKYVLSYIDEFYNELEDKDYIKKQFRRTCE